MNLPVPVASAAMSFEFGSATYLDMFNYLSTSDNEEFYRKMGVLDMLQRNMGVKEMPERYVWLLSICLGPTQFPVQLAT